MSSRKTLSPKKASEKISDLKTKNETIVLVGGCFDILHAGHIAFLKAAKNSGDKLFILLESDDAIRQKKGNSRPIHTQEDRASILSSLNSVDYIILLPHLKSDAEYDELIFALKPDIIAITKGDSGKIHKLRQANLIDAKVIEVIGKIEEVSTTKLKNELDKKLWET